MSDQTWGFIGLGKIGYPKAMNLRNNMPDSHNLVTLDINAVVMERFVEEAKRMATSNGAVIESRNVEMADYPREVAEKSGMFSQTVIVTCLPSPQVVKDLFGSIPNDGKLPLLEQEPLFIDCSTIDPPSSRGVANAVRETGTGCFVDAPVSGGVVGAWAGTLSFMFGAPKLDPLIERIQSVLSLVGNTSLHMGQQGAGAFNMAQKWGLNLNALTELIKSSTRRCWPVEYNNPVPDVDENAPFSKRYEPGGTVNIIKEDPELAIAGAEASGVVAIGPESP